MPDLIEALQNEWAQSPTETLQNLAESLPTRVKVRGVQLHIKVYVFECNVIEVPVDVRVRCPNTSVHVVYVVQLVCLASLTTVVSGKFTKNVYNMI